MAACALAPSALAQDAPAGVLKTRDASVYVGHIRTFTDSGDPFDYDDRVSVVVGTFAAGYYWTENWKTEVEFARSSEDRYSGARFVTLPDVPRGHRVYTVNETSMVLVTAAQSYQFFHNAWFHPFVTAGVDVAWERTRVETPDQFYYPPPVFGPTGAPTRVPPPVPIPGEPPVETTVLKPRVFGGTGFKAYLTPQAFFRGDVRIGVGSQRIDNTFRVGFGVDF